MKPLQGYKVIDASRILVGAVGSLQLRDLGAEVIKIEARGRGDEIRHWGPPFISGDEKVSTYYASLNRDKKSITVDLKKQEGKQIIKDLVKASDIYVQNFPPRTNERLGLQYEELSKANPSLIYASVSGYPLVSEELKNKAAFDLTM